MLYIVEYIYLNYIILIQNFYAKIIIHIGFFFHESLKITNFRNDITNSINYKILFVTMHRVAVYLFVIKIEKIIVKWQELSSFK